MEGVESNDKNRAMMAGKSSLRFKNINLNLTLTFLELKYAAINLKRHINSKKMNPMEITLVFVPRVMSCKVVISL